MTYLQRSSEKTSRRRKNIKFLMIFLGIVLFGFVLRTFSANVLHSVLYPVTRASNFVFAPVKNFGYYLYSKPKLVEENKTLQNDKKFLQIELLSFENLRKENEELKNILGIKKTDSEIVAEILLAPPFSPYDTFVVRTEEIDNVQLKSIVLANNVILGEVIEKHGKNAIVKLFSTSGQKTPVKIRDEVIAEAEGQGGYSFKMQLPKDVPVSNGDLIYSMQHHSAFLGLVESIETSENSSFQTIRFKFPFSFADINFVLIRPI